MSQIALMETPNSLTLRWRLRSLLLGGRGVVYSIHDCVVMQVAPAPHPSVHPLDAGGDLLQRLDVLHRRRAMRQLAGSAEFRRDRFIPESSGEQRPAVGSAVRQFAG